MNDEETIRDMDDDDDSYLTAYADSLSKLGIDQRTHLLDEVVVTARRRTREQDIYRNRTTSLTYYDIQSERDNLYDRGVYTGKDIQQILLSLSPDFNTVWVTFYEGLRAVTKELFLYGNKMPLFIINHEPSSEPSLAWLYNVLFPTTSSVYPINLLGAVSGSVSVVESYIPYAHNIINPNAIKSIFINEDKSVIKQYANYEMSDQEKERLYGCVVFIETHEDMDIYADDAKGVRKTWLDGYSTVREFYSPNYSELPPVSDYRRTLYWNPMVTTDETGRANIQFYNNSNSRNFSISAETVTPSGLIGIYKE